MQVYNHHFSPLHRLPWELILEIVEHMTPVDRIVFRMSCRRHAVIDGFIRELQITEVERRDLNRRLERDRYDVLAALEPPNAHLLGSMLCSTCKISHSSWDFTEIEAEKPTRQRKCRGAVNTFRLCPHQILDFETLRKRRLDRADNELPDIACRECYYRTATYTPLYTSINRTKSGEVHTFCMILNQASSVGELSRAEFRNYLEQYSIIVCPHKRLNDSTSLDALLNDPIGQIRKKPRPSDWSAKPLGSFYAARTCKCCDSTAFVGRVVAKGRGRIVAGVHRNLGTMEDPLDPHWLAHLGKSEFVFHMFSPISRTGQRAVRRMWTMIEQNQI
jgi:hypothetical protein